MSSSIGDTVHQQQEDLRNALRRPGACRPEGFCTAMASAMNDVANARAKGLSTVVVMNINTGEERLIGVAYKAKASDRGIMLNHCPWCGAAILWDKPRETAETA